MLRAIGEVVERIRRHRRISVSTSERIDAPRAAEAVGVEDRFRLSTALAATLCKGRREREAFDEAFSAVFRTPAVGGGRKTRKARLGGGAERGVSSAWHDRPGRQGQPEQGDSRTLRGRATPERGRLRRVLGSRAGQEERAHARRTAPHLAVPGTALARAVRYRELKARMTVDDAAALSAEVPRIVQEIRSREGRRLVRSNGGRLFLRGAMRQNLSHGGIPFILHMRRKKPRSSRVLLLVDVSHSVTTSAALFLAIALSFMKLSRSSRVFLFVDHPVEATDALRQWAHARENSGVDSFLRLVAREHALNLQVPSDYGRAIYALRNARLAGSRDEVLAVPGDGRVNRFDPQNWVFEELALRRRAVIWLVPEGRELWGSGDSALPGYMPHCDVAVEARDLEGLALGVKEILRAL